MISLFLEGYIYFSCRVLRSCELSLLPFGLTILRRVIWSRMAKIVTKTAKSTVLELLEPVSVTVTGYLLPRGQKHCLKSPHATSDIWSF
jgi:hypothetical protein